jgi:hypothetical protein
VWDGIDGEGGARGSGLVAEAIQNGGFEGVSAWIGREVALHGDDLAMLVVELIGSFVQWDVVAEALENGAFIVLDL